MKVFITSKSCSSIITDGRYKSIGNCTSQDLNRQQLNPPPHTVCEFGQYGSSTKDHKDIGGQKKLLGHLARGEQVIIQTGSERARWQVRELDRATGRNMDTKIRNKN